jgi:hypothetical protein
MFLTSPSDDISRLYTLDISVYAHIIDINLGAARLGWYVA